MPFEENKNMSSTGAGFNNNEMLPASFGGEYLFEKIEPAENCRRQYRITCRSTLWQEFAIERSWGRIGIKNPASNVLVFEQEADALKWLRRFISRRLRRGYTLVSTFHFEVVYQTFPPTGD
jgi:predicted DNA-binding WGR domain protein